MLASFGLLAIVRQQLLSRQTKRSAILCLKDDFASWLRGLDDIHHGCSHLLGVLELGVLVLFIVTLQGLQDFLLLELLL